MKKLKIIDILIASLTGKIRADSIVYYKETYPLSSLTGNDHITKDQGYEIVASGASHFTVNKLGGDVNVDGNIDTSADLVPATSFLLAVEIDGEPDVTQHFYSRIQGLVYGFDTSISPTAQITITFI